MMTRHIGVVILLLCGTQAIAEKKPMIPWRFSGPTGAVSIQGGVTAGNVGTTIYESGGGGYYFYCDSCEMFPEAAEEMTGANLNHNREYGAWISEVTFAAVTVGVGQHVNDVELTWYDTTEAEFPGGGLALADPSGGLRLENLSVTNSEPISGWFFIVDVSSFPGGGIPVTNRNFGYAMSAFDSIGVPAADMQPMWVSGANVGVSGNQFYVDENGDGSFQAIERRYWNDDPNFQANMVVLFRACLPCDTDCNGTMNVFDIQGFISALSGQLACSPCAGDCDVNGSTNTFDIQAFLACLGI